MTAGSVVSFESASSGRFEREQQFDLYCLLLRQFIEPVFGWDEAFQRQRFENEYPEELVQVILVGQNCAGIVVVLKQVESHHVALLLLHPHFQRRGVGREVMFHILANAKSRRKRVTLSCFAKNQPAVQFYKSIGFSITSKEPNFIVLSSAA